MTSSTSASTVMFLTANFENTLFRTQMELKFINKT